ncbi:MAG: hypothetical protein ACOYLG_01215 [Chitinophagaceae bacterium]|jgi:hypothetical protein
MNVKLIGSFVFMNQSYGILSGLYHNNIDTDPFPESAKRRKSEGEITDVFAGVYNTVWLETGNKDDNTELEITRKSNGTYELRWYDAQKTYYNGIGFIHDGKLIGSYWQL